MNVWRMFVIIGYSSLLLSGSRRCGGAAEQRRGRHLHHGVLHGRDRGGAGVAPGLGDGGLDRHGQQHGPRLRVDQQQHRQLLSTVRVSS